MSSSLAFLKQFICHPGKVGAVLPSSKFLAREMVLHADIAHAQVIAEFGAGTGVFTEEILHTKPEEALFIAIEQNPQLAAILRSRLPKAIIKEDSAVNLPQMLHEHHAQQVDSIVCGLPWAAFSEELQDTLLGAAFDSLKPGGHFCTFAYLQGLLLPAGQRFAKKIRNRFSEVRKSPVVWKNVPPAFVYICRK